MADDVFIEYTSRRLQTVPCSLHGHIRHKSIIHLLNHACKEMRLLRLWGSRFMAFHLARMLSENKDLPETMTNYTLRSMFVCVAKGSRETKDKDVIESLDLWKKSCGDDVSFPCINGLNTITTSTFEEFFVSFENYHKYAMQHHWAYLVSRLYSIPKKQSRMVIRSICDKFKVDAHSDMDSMDDDSTNITVEDKEKLQKIVDEELRFLPCYDEQNNLTQLRYCVLLHYKIAKRIQEVTENQLTRVDSKFKNSSKMFAMTPFCNAQIPSVQFCKKSICDLIAFAKSKNSQSVIKDYVRRNVVEAFKNFKELKDLFILKNRKEWILSPTFKTDGYLLCLIWQKEVTRKKYVTQKEYIKHCEKKEIMLMKWEDEVSRALSKGIAPDLRKRTALDKQVPVLLCDGKIYPSKKIDEFHQEKSGLYSSRIIHNLNIPENTPVYGVDPGMIDIVSCAKKVWNSKDSDCTANTENTQRNNKVPIWSKNLSSKSFNARIRVGEQIPVIQGLSECSLREIDPDKFLDQLVRYARFVPEIIATWGNENQRKNSFKRQVKKRKFYDTIVDELFPEENSIIFMGNGNIQTTMKGTSTSPLGKLLKEIVKKRRLVMVRESFTTKRCSCCQRSDSDLRELNNLRKGLQTTESGKHYYSKIHGLRQCQHCARTWNRDFNAARNIFFNAVSYVETGKPCGYLSRHIQVLDNPALCEVTAAACIQTTFEIRNTQIHI